MSKIITFRGCIFDDGWEFDCPCIVYSPLQRYRIGSNVYGVLDLVEDIAADLIRPGKLRRGWDESVLKEFKWRGWSPHGFAKRRQAWHVEVKVRFFEDAEGHDFKIVWARERFGLKGKWSILK